MQEQEHEEAIEQAHACMCKQASLSTQLETMGKLKQQEEVHLHEGVQIDFPSPQDGVLPRLLHFGDSQGVALVDFAQALHHLGQLGRVQGLCGNLHDRLALKLQGLEDVDLVLIGLRNDGRCLGDSRIDALQQNPIPCSSSILKARRAEADGDDRGREPEGEWGGAVEGMSNGSSNVPVRLVCQSTA